MAFNAKGLNAPFKTGTDQVDQTTDPTMCPLQETYFKYKDKYRLQVSGQRKTYCDNTNQKKVRVAILIQTKQNAK